MSPAGPGGRPRNAWTSSRRRKLVRLYTMTTLTQDEIIKILKANDFNPYKRDVQKTLGSLLPKDFTKEHRRYRPSNYVNMKRRYKQIRLCIQRRITKARRRFSHNHPRQEYALQLGTAAANVIKDFQPSKVCTESTVAAISRAYPSVASMEGLSRTTSLHTADGCILARPNGERFRNCQTTMSASKLSRSPPFEKASGLTTNFTSKSLPFASTSISSPTAASTACSSTESAKRRGNASSSIPSFGSLERRLNYQPDIARHVESVLRLSISDSWTSRTSTTSWTSSWMSSGSSRGSLHLPGSPSVHPPVPSKNHLDSGTRITQDAQAKSQTDFSQSELDVWNDLVDESKLLPEPSDLKDHLTKRNECDTLPLLERHCCGLVRAPCRECGFSLIHYRARTRQQPWILSNNEHNQQDYFGNTPLHHCAASGGVGIASITWLIESGTQINVRNSAGQTFLHVLNTNTLAVDSPGCPNYSGLLKLLKHLRDLSFKFEQLDFLGRTISHFMFNCDSPFCLKQGIRQSREDHLELSYIRYILQTDSSTADAFAVQVLDLVRYWDDGSFTEDFKQMDTSYRILEFKDKIQQLFMFADKTISVEIPIWLAFLEKERLFGWIDTAGDTPLTALIASWPTSGDPSLLVETVRKLISSGTEVNMRNRKGNTALSLATLRGERLTVKLLLESGATPNSRGFDGVGILRCAAARMKEAEGEKDERLYACILSCFVLLVDAGAKAKPTLRDEWLTQAARIRLETEEDTEMITEAE